MKTEPTAGHYLGCRAVLLPAVTPILKWTGTTNARFSRLCLVYVCRGNASLGIRHGICVRRIWTQSRVMTERGVFRTVLVAQHQCAEYFASCTHRATLRNQIITEQTDHFGEVCCEMGIRRDGRTGIRHPGVETKWPTDPRRPLLLLFLSTRSSLMAGPRNATGPADQLTSAEFYVLFQRWKNNRVLKSGWICSRHPVVGGLCKRWPPASIRYASTRR
jgi:hypothetical protein